MIIVVGWTFCGQTFQKSSRVCSNEIPDLFPSCLHLAIEKQRVPYINFLRLQLWRQQTIFFQLKNQRGKCFPRNSLSLRPCNFWWLNSSKQLELLSPLFFVFVVERPIVPHVAQVSLLCLSGLISTLFSSPHRSLIN